MKPNISRFLVISATISLALSLIFSSQVNSVTTIEVSLGAPVVDVCPNIPGTQPTVPAGMIIDGSGNCVTPPPPVVDVCLNMPGDQTTIPEGYYRDNDGNCHPQPSPPIDVCPNLFGIQAVVPSSLIVDENGNCIAPPVDECPNIDGPQSSIPVGMVKIDGVCFTPETAQPTEPQDNLPEPDFWPVATKTTYKNVPEILTPLVKPLVEAVPENVKEFVKTVPVEVARTVPYYIYALLAVTALVMLVQAVREVTATRFFLVLLKREKSIAEQKDNFIALASHYLRTPLTLMRNGLDTLVALKEVTEKKIAPLRTPIEQMDQDIASIIADIEGNEALKDIKPPEELDAKHKKPARSIFFWGAIIGSLVLTLVANFMLGVVADVDLGTANLLFQIIVITAVSIFFYTSFRNFFIKRRERKRQQVLMDHEYTVDEARNKFIKEATDVLRQGLEKIYNQRQVISSAPSAKFFEDGYNRFNSILEKFVLLSTLQASVAIPTTKLHLKELVDEAIEELSEMASEQKVAITNEVDPSLVVEQNRKLLSFVVKTVIDNAIKFNIEGGKVTIGANKSSKHITVNVSDSGIGIPKEKLPQLFKPFSRANSALEFNYEGLGFSLFLNKIITDYIGGDITASSQKDVGTDISVKLKHQPDKK